MTPAKANQRSATHALTGGGYHRNGTNLVLARVLQGHDQEALDRMNGALELERIIGFKPGTEFKP